MIVIVDNFISKLAANPVIFSWLRKVIEFNFIKQKRLIKKLLDGDGGNVLDIGCGTGEFADSFSKLEYYGVDINDAYINYAKKKKRGNFQVMDALRLQFTDNNFDRILIMAIIHHLDNDSAELLLREAKRVVKPGGKILIMEDAKIRSIFNFITIFFQKIDKGSFIRTLSGYKDVISRVFTVRELAGFRSGLVTYGYFFIDSVEK